MLNDWRAGFSNSGRRFMLMMTMNLFSNSGSGEEVHVDDDMNLLPRPPRCSNSRLSGKLGCLSSVEVWGG